MKIENFTLNASYILNYDRIDEETSTKIIEDAVGNIREWGLKYPDVHHKFSDDPNANYSNPMKYFIGLFDIVDFTSLF